MPRPRRSRVPVPQRRGVQAALLLALTLAGVVAGARPAAADPAKPTNDRIAIASVDPAPTGLRVEVVGDSFLRLRAERGTVVAIPGYESEPYLRIDADGVVWENERSPAVALNRSRFGGTPRAGESPDATAAPQWRRIGSGGEVLWHDHRTHWMSRVTPPQLGGRSSGRILSFSLAVTVNGAPVTITGSLDRLPAPLAWPWWLGALAGSGALTALLVLGAHPGRGDRRPFGRLGGALTVTGLAAVAVTAVDVAARATIPSAAATRPVAAVFAALAVVAAAAGGLLRRRRPFHAAALLAGAGAALLGNAVLDRAVIGHAVLPSDLSPVLQRLAVVAAAACGVAALVAGARALVVDGGTAGYGVDGARPAKLPA